MESATSAPDLGVPAELSRRRLRTRLIAGIGVALVVVALIGALPGLDGLRTRLAHAQPLWLILACVLKLLSSLSYVAVFRAVFCRRMGWRVSYEIGMSELGANALFPTAGAGGLALGAWALRRGGMPGERIARRTVAFFLLTSLANVGALIVVGIGLATGVLGGKSNLLLTVVPAAVAALAIVIVIGVGALAARVNTRLARNRLGGPSRAMKLLAAAADGVSEALGLLREGDPRLLLGSAGYLAFDIMMLWATFHAFGHSPSVAVIWIAYLIGELGGLIPVPGGIGGVDAGLIGAFALYGTPLGAATAAVLAYRVIALWIPALFGALAFAALRRTLRDEQSRMALCAPGSQMDVVGAGRIVVDRL